MSHQPFAEFARILANQGAKSLHPNLPFLWVPALVLFAIYSQFSAGLSLESETAVSAIRFQAAKTTEHTVVSHESTLFAIPPALESLSLTFLTPPTRIGLPVSADELRRPGNIDALRMAEETVVVASPLQGVTYPLLVYVDAAPVGEYAAGARPPEKILPLKIGQGSFSLMLLAMFSAPVFSFGVAVCFLQNSIIISKEGAGRDVDEKGSEQDLLPGNSK